MDSISASGPRKGKGGVLPHQADETGRSVRAGRQLVRPFRSGSGACEVHEAGTNRNCDMPRGFQHDRAGSAPEGWSAVSGWPQTTSAAGRLCTRCGRRDVSPGWFRLRLGGASLRGGCVGGMTCGCGCVRGQQRQQQTGSTGSAMMMMMEDGSRGRMMDDGRDGGGEGIPRCAQKPMLIRPRAETAPYAVGVA